MLQWRKGRKQIDLAAAMQHAACTGVQGAHRRAGEGEGWPSTPMQAHRPDWLQRFAPGGPACVARATPGLLLPPACHASSIKDKHRLRRHGLQVAGAEGTQGDCGRLGTEEETHNGCA